MATENNTRGKEQDQKCEKKEKKKKALLGRGTIHCSTFPCNKRNSLTLPLHNENNQLLLT
jgi:hypothetical protein